MNRCSESSTDSQSSDNVEDTEQITYFEESSESEPEAECDLWDADCKIVRTPISSLVGYHLMPTCLRDPDTNPKKRLKLSPQINRGLLKKTFVEKFEHCFTNNERFCEHNVELVIEPFKACIINDFIDNDNFLDCVRNEFNEVDWNLRHMDLYEFFQSKDLKYVNHEYIKETYKFLEREVMPWVARLTGFSLTHISATCSLYSNTDYLLVHDDQREDRMVAFVLYLTSEEGWDESKGGALRLLDKDKHGQPNCVVRDVFPSNNQLVFFPVTNDSYHQVGEVTTREDCRLSINGWFHAKVPPVFSTPHFEPFTEGLYGSSSVKPQDMTIDLKSWINEDYLSCRAIRQIQSYIEENSEISLHSFFKKEPLDEINSFLSNPELKWRKIGPPNRYCYEILVIENLPHILERLLQLFQSKEIFSLLNRYTDLDLMTEKASMRFELQRWTPGSYSVLTDYDWQEKNELDAILYFGCKAPSDVIGARIQYVTIEDEIQNALITLEPQENCLNVVYRDTARFTKYYSLQSKCQCFYTLICSYAE